MVVFVHVVDYALLGGGVFGGLFGVCHIVVMVCMCLVGSWYGTAVDFLDFLQGSLCLRRTFRIL